MFKPFLFFFYIALYNHIVLSTDYCKICKNNSHTMCQYKEGPSCSCRNYSSYNITKDIKWRIVRLHNILRNKVASGSETHGKKCTLPPARNMLLMKWDNELAKIAQRWADQCISIYEPNQHDQCKTTDRFSVGQNVISGIKGNGEYPSFEELIKLMIMEWYKEVNRITQDDLNRFKETTGPTNEIGHYSQMVWANTQYIGCAHVAFVQEIKKWDTAANRTIDRLICNYGPTGNVINASIYKRGLPCTERKCSHKIFPALCDRGPNPESIEITNRIMRTDTSSKDFQTYQTFNMKRSVQDYEVLDDLNKPPFFVLKSRELHYEDGGFLKDLQKIQNATVYKGVEFFTTEYHPTDFLNYQGGLQDLYSTEVDKGIDFFTTKYFTTDFLNYQEELQEPDSTVDKGADFFTSKEDGQTSKPSYSNLPHQLFEFAEAFKNFNQSTNKKLLGDLYKLYNKYSDNISGSETIITDSYPEETSPILIYDQINFRRDWDNSSIAVVSETTKQLDLETTSENATGFCATLKKLEEEEETKLTKATTLELSTPKETTRPKDSRLKSNTLKAVSVSKETTLEESTPNENVTKESMSSTEKGKENNKKHVTRKATPTSTKTTKRTTTTTTTERTKITMKAFQKHETHVTQDMYAKKWTLPERPLETEKHPVPHALRYRQGDACYCLYRIANCSTKLLTQNYPLVLLLFLFYLIF